MIDKAETACCRFAPSATGPAHPGTLLAALLSWLDARVSGARLILRIEDLDPQRCSPAKSAALIGQLAWFGLAWDAIEYQSDHGTRHQAALRRLAEGGLLYECDCSRATIRAHGLRACDGGWVYPGTCRSRLLSAKQLAAADGAWRVRLDETLSLRDEGGTLIAVNIPQDLGDPVVRRRDGVPAYHLAAVVDDAALGVTRVVRGRDLLTSCAPQVALARCLGFTIPDYRHHLLLLEVQGRKYAKFHGAVGVPELSAHYDPSELCGFLAWVAGLQSHPRPCTPEDLLADFSWQRVRNNDQVVTWDGHALHWQQAEEV